MKHDIGITIILVVFFVLAQLVGLALINLDIKEIKLVEGVPTLIHGDTSLGPRPEMSGSGAFAYVAIGLIVGTLLVLLIIRLKKVNLWKAWFFLAVFLAMSLALGVLVNAYVAFAIALVLAIFKVVKPNLFVHNLTEVLMYSGIAVFLVPLFGNGTRGVLFLPENVFWAAMLLILISFYDMYAVWKSKHMVKMAQFQAESKVFAGLFIPYTPKDQGKTAAEKAITPPKGLKAAKQQKVEKRNAILGGGDIAFPLLFTGAVMESLVVSGLSKVAAFQQSMIITLTTTIALALLFILAKKDKFYPAMPFVTAGCFIGYCIVVLL